MHGSLVAAASVDDSDEAVVFGFHILITEAELAEKFDSAHFKPNEVVGVVDDAHLIGLGIAHADTGLVHRWARTADGCRISTHCPVHLGLRFSRNAVTPSRKSAVARMAAFSRMAASIW